MTYGNPCKGTIRPYNPKANVPDGVPRVTQPFHTKPMLIGGVWVARHLAIDIGFGRAGDQILAAKTGRVYRAQFEPPPDNALNVFIEHVGGMATQYGHCRDEIVSVGQQVAMGKVIGHVGSTGNVSGPHIHFAIFRADIGVDSGVDPWPLLAQNQPAPKEVTLRKLDEIRVRNGSNTSAVAYAETKDGRLIRNGKDIGPLGPYKYGGKEMGGAWKVTVDGKTIIGSEWVKLLLSGRYRFVASALAVVE